ncbi:hypothetical protein LTR53_006292 [Teratosphaeriaceae sp. CCFEE 6253]|nr:hypothetical protein LTR53_006292 [Teratosphaeriaceae sp. CCFEE 6253]
MAAAATGTCNDRLTDLLFSLPPELRNEIYTLCLPDGPRRAVTAEKRPQLRWLCCSAKLFAEAATLLYSDVPFYAATGLPHGPHNASVSLLGDFEYHCRATYDRKLAGAVHIRAASMVRTVVVDIRVHEYCQARDLPDRVRIYFAGVAGTFTGLKRLCINFGPSFMITDPDSAMATSSDNAFPNVNRVVEERGLRVVVSAAQALAPPGCKVHWSIFQSLNMFDAGCPKRRH